MLFRLTLLSRELFFIEGSNNMWTHRNIRAKDQYASLEGASTLYESFKRSVHQYPTENFIGERKMENGRAGPYEFLTFKQVEGKRSQLTDPGMPYAWPQNCS